MTGEERIDEINRLLQEAAEQDDQENNENPRSATGRPGARVTEG